MSRRPTNKDTLAALTALTSSIKTLTERMDASTKKSDAEKKPKEKDVFKGNAELSRAKAEQILSGKRISVLANLTEKQIEKQKKLIAKEEEALEKAVATAYYNEDIGLKNRVTYYTEQLAQLYWNSKNVEDNLSSENKQLTNNFKELEVIINEIESDEILSKTDEIKNKIIKFTKNAIIYLTIDGKTTSCNKMFMSKETKLKRDKKKEVF
mgnify:CR=1 FL=1